MLGRHPPDRAALERCAFRPARSNRGGPRDGHGLRLRGSSDASGGRFPEGGASGRRPLRSEMDLARLGRRRLLNYPEEHPARLGPARRAAIIEMVRPERVVPTPTFLMDLNMLVAFGGRERTRGVRRAPRCRRLENRSCRPHPGPLPDHRGRAARLSSGGVRTWSTAPQLTATKGMSRREESACTTRAASSLPVPVSPDESSSDRVPPRFNGCVAAAYRVDGSHKPASWRRGVADRREVRVGAVASGLYRDFALRPRVAAGPSFAAVFRVPVPRFRVEAYGSNPPFALFLLLETPPPPRASSSRRASAPPFRTRGSRRPRTSPAERPRFAPRRPTRCSRRPPRPS